jgi:phosphomecalonate degydratase large subunit
MQLTKDEEKSLSGEFGETMASAYRILLSIGAATDAEKLVPIKWAHISGVNYNTIGDAGVEFLEEFSQNTKTAVKTTINPMGFDRGKVAATNVSQSFIEQQMKIVKSFESIGAFPSFTCIPYEIFDIPPKGTVVSFAESNAAIYSNSVLGLFTNKESSLSALASSITGKAPYSGLRIEEFRHPKVTIKSNIKLQTELDYGLLGYFAGNQIKDDCVALDGISENADTIKTKSLSAAMGTSGTCGMFAQKEYGLRQDVVSFDQGEMNKIRDELNTSESGDIIVLGSPQLGISELKFLTDQIRYKKFSKRCLIFCARKTYWQAEQIGLTGKIERAGSEFMCDSCACLTPLVSKADVDSVITNSVKGAYYLGHSNRVGVALKDLKTIIKEYSN